MSLESRLSELITAIGADVKALQGMGAWEKEFSFPGSLSLYTGQGRVTNLTGRTLTIQTIFASVGTAPTAASIIINVRKNGTTLYTTGANKPKILGNSYSIVSTNMDVTTFAPDDYLTVDIEQIGSTIAGSDLTVQVVAV